MPTSKLNATLDLASIDPNRRSLVENLVAALAADSSMTGASTTNRLPRLQPGDLITSDLINQIISRLEDVQTNVSDTKINLGQLGTDTHTLVALGTGFETRGGMWVDGKPLLVGEPSRGVNLVVLDSNLNRKFQGSYDLLLGDAAAMNLAKDIATHTARGDIVLGVTHDAYIEGLKGIDSAPRSARAALASIGAASLCSAAESQLILRKVRVRDNAAFIGVTPTNKSSVSFDYLVSVMPADADGAADARLAALPFAWGIYSIPLQRFILGGSSGTPPFPDFVLRGPIGTPIPIPLGNLDLRLEDPVTKLPGIGQTERDKLHAAGVDNINAFINLPTNKLMDIINLNPEDAAALIAQVNKMLGR